MSWLEVETKVRVRNVEKLRKDVKKIARFVKKETKKDAYYAVHKNGYPKKAFRIRTSGKKHVVNFKKWLKDHWDKDIIVKEEFEFSVEDSEAFLALMNDLGFQKWISKTKISESYQYHADTRLVIEINHILELGYFMEIEYLCSRSELGNAKKRIREVLKTLGIQRSYLDNIGYTKLLWRKREKKKN